MSIRPHRIFGILVLLLLCLVVASALPFIQPAHAQFEFVIGRVKPAVVLITVKDVLGGEARGSGFIYDPAGYLLTNHHVVEGATEITVTLSDRRSFPATVIDYINQVEYSGNEIQTIADVAVLKIDATDLPTLQLGDSDILRQGQEILVFGYPGGVGTEEVSVTRGIISAIRAGWVQTDAAIVPGNSGGPVVDRLGRVVGLATFVTGPSARFVRIGGMVAINPVKSVADSAAKATGSRALITSVSGMEYVPRISIGRRSKTRETYDPGLTRNQPQTSERTSEVTSVQDFAGAKLYVLRTSAGFDVKNYLTTQALLQVSVTDPHWTYNRPEPYILFLFPLLVGRSWQNRWVRDSLEQQVRRVESEDWQVESTSETTSTSLGSFSQVLRMVARFETSIIQGGRTANYHGIITQWWAPSIGSLRYVREIFETKERIVDETISMNF